MTNRREQYEDAMALLLTLSETADDSDVTVRLVDLMGELRDLMFLEVRRDIAAMETLQ